jgi:hypothetical protein
VSVKIPSTRATARDGVNAAQAFFESCGCIFQEVAQQNDFGKDAYVDLADGKTVSPFCVAVQIKAGRSFRKSDGSYFLPVESHADNWRRSTVPVFGLVYDPDDRTLRWGDLTAYLRTRPEQDGGTVPISRDAILDECTIRTGFAKAVGAYALLGGAAVALNLLSRAEHLQADVVFDAWALGRQNARFLILLRRLILDLSFANTRRAIAALSHATPHPDILWHKGNWIPEAVEREVQRSFRWSPAELAHMLAAIDVEDWGRGTLGQSFDMLVYQDPDDLAGLHRSVGVLIAQSNVEIAARAATVALAHAENARVELSLLKRDYPELCTDDWFAEVATTVEEFGGLSLY